MKSLMALCALSTLLGAACTRSRTPPPPNSAEPEGSRPAQAGRAGSAVARDHELPLGNVKLKPGFRIAPYATNVEGARSMALSPNQTLYVGTRKNDKVYAIPNADHDPTGDRVVTIAENMDTPNGVAFHAGALYVAEIDKIWRFDAIDSQIDHPPKPVLVSKAFPDDEHHGWKFIGIGPDSRLYVPVGAPCNVCEKSDPRYASITRLNLDGGGFEVFASGVRNTVGFDWHPETRVLWFTDNGRDWMGDDLPPDELDLAPRAGLHFGFPYCHGKTPDPKFGEKRSCAEFTPPAALLDAHVAALGMRFYTGKMFPAEYKNQIFIAEHGSWNRSSKVGYRVTLARLDGERVRSYEVFAEGWLHDGDVWGRPVDVLVMPDGALLVSDDQANAIYRISYEGS